MDALAGAMKDSTVLPPLNPLGVPSIPLGNPVDVEAIVKDVKGGIVEVASGFTPQKVAFEIGGMVFIWFQGIMESRKKSIEAAKLERHQYNSFILDIARKAWLRESKEKTINQPNNAAKNETTNQPNNAAKNETPRVANLVIRENSTPGERKPDENLP